MIQFKNVTKIYQSTLGPVVAIKDVSFEVRENEFVSIAGRSGAGKTTLLKLLLREEFPTRGQIFFEGKDINTIKSKDLPEFRRKIGAVFQDYKLFPSKTAWENLSFVMEVTGATNHEINTVVPKVLEIVELQDRAYHFPSQLSGGERQRIAIARALIHRPKVILADEPTGNLDTYHTRDIIRLLLKVHQMGTTVILATHNKEIINSLERRVIMLEKGKIIRDEEKGRFIL